LLMSTNLGCMPLHQRYDPEQSDEDALRGELGMMGHHLTAIDTSTSGMGEALEAVADLGDSALVALDDESNLVGATTDGEDLLHEMDIIDRAVRNARRIVQARIAALDEGE
jgi:hypothetical protein